DGAASGSPIRLGRIAQTDPARTPAWSRIRRRRRMNSIDNLLHEARRFPPAPEFAGDAVAKPELYEAAKADRLAFWADQARDLVTWRTPFTEVLDWSNAPFARWFADGTLNVAENCLDRHVANGIGDRVAIHWE